MDPDSVARLIPARYADPVTVGVIVAILRAGAPSPDTLAYATLRTETRATLAALLAEPIAARDLFRAARQPVPAWLAHRLEHPGRICVRPLDPE